MGKVLRAISGNNRIVALLMIVALSAASAFGVPMDGITQITDPVLDWLVPGGDFEGSDGKTYTQTEIGFWIYGLFAVGLALWKRKTGRPENPDVETGEERSIARRYRMGQRFTP